MDDRVRQGNSSHGKANPCWIYQGTFGRDAARKHPVQSTTMCRTAFFHRHDIHYKRYVHAEDMQFWCDAAKHGAGFFVESQILNYYRHRQEQISCVYNQEQQTTALTIRAECLEWLMIHRIHDTDIHAFYQAAGTLKNKAYLNDMPYYAMFYNLIKEYISNQSRL